MAHTVNCIKSQWDKLNEASAGRLDERVRELRKKHPLLTKMEARISVLYLERYDHAAIARKLSIEIHTVENHSYNARIKLKAPHGARFISLFDDIPPLDTSSG